MGAPLVGTDEFCDLMVDEGRATDLKREALGLAFWDLTSRQVWDIELLLNGVFCPLQGFLNQADYGSVCGRMRLQTGALWPIPVNLDVAEIFADGLSVGDRTVLRHHEGIVLATLTVESIWTPDFRAEAG